MLQGDLPLHHAQLHVAAQALDVPEREGGCIRGLAGHDSNLLEGRSPRTGSTKVDVVDVSAGPIGEHRDEIIGRPAHPHLHQP